MPVTEISSGLERCASQWDPANKLQKVHTKIVLELIGSSAKMESQIIHFKNETFLKIAPYVQRATAEIGSIDLGAACHRRPPDLCLNLTHQCNGAECGRANNYLGLPKVAC